MDNKDTYQMAVDLLKCHLDITEEEAHQQLGITPESMDKQFLDTHLMAEAE
ncbi:hypothetical protein N9R79_00275 [Vibrio sp.]|nr:hypothetical protein [Vibrio sp.]